MFARYLSEVLVRKSALTMETSFPVLLLCYAAKTRTVYGISMFAVSTLPENFWETALGVRKNAIKMELGAGYLRRILSLAIEGSRCSM